MTRLLRDAETNEGIGDATVEQIDASDQTDTGFILVDAGGGVIAAQVANQPWVHGVRKVYVEE